MTPPDESISTIDRMLEEVMVKHFEMAGMVGEYRQMIAGLADRPDEDSLRLARSLPGARYSVSTTYVREQWLKVDAEIKKAFPAAG